MQSARGPEELEDEEDDILIDEVEEEELEEEARRAEEALMAKQRQISESRASPRGVPGGTRRSVRRRRPRCTALSPLRWRELRRSEHSSARFRNAVPHASPHTLLFTTALEGAAQVRPVLCLVFCLGPPCQPAYTPFHHCATVPLHTIHAKVQACPVQVGAEGGGKAANGLSCTP